MGKEIKYWKGVVPIQDLEDPTKEELLRSLLSSLIQGNNCCGCGCCCDGDHGDDEEIQAVADLIYGKGKTEYRKYFGLREANYATS